MGCARCHDHKFDPISTKDFYSMAAFFRNTTQPAMDDNVMDSPPILRMPRAEDATRYAALPGEIDAAKKAYDFHVEAAEPAFMTLAADAGARRPPDDRGRTARLPPPLRPSRAHHPAQRGRSGSAFTFTGGKPQVVTSPLGPALRLATGVTADLGDAGRRRIR